MPEIPEGAKVPTDRQRAKAEVEDSFVEAEFNGATYRVMPSVFEDAEFLEDIGDLEDNPELLPRVTRRMLGVDQWKAFKDANRVDGVVSTQALGELFDALNEALGNR